MDGLDLLVLSGVRKRADITLRAGDSSCDSRPVFGVGMAIVALCVRGGGLCIALIAQFKASNGGHAFISGRIAIRPLCIHQPGQLGVVIQQRGERG